MALWKPFLGTRAALDTVEKHPGYVYWCADDGSLHFDYTDADGNLQRKQISAENAETLCGVSLEELKNKISTQDAVILHEAQAYTDIQINDVIITRIAELERIINNSPLVDNFDGFGTLDAGYIFDTNAEDMNIIDPGAII
jgi:hypothetical protein